MIILWSDAIVFFLTLVVLVSIALSINNYQIRTRWRKVYNRPFRMIAMVILAFFAVIGILDSIHFVQNNTVVSVLDWLMLPMSMQAETSYSAPFATHLFRKEMIKSSTGEIDWISPALQYVQPTNIFLCVLKGAMCGLLLMLLPTLILIAIIKARHQTIKMRKTWLIAWVTTTCILMLIFVCYSLMRHYHILGTDKIGVDVFYASVKSIRTGLIIGLLTTILTLPFAILLGALAGYFGGWIDDAIQYLYTTLSSIPGVLLIAASMLSLDALISRHTDYFSYMVQRTDVRLLTLCAILGVTSWTTLCRILRGETLKLREQEFVLAAKVLGLNTMRIITRHIVPNLAHIILISLVIDFSGLVLAEAVLTYVGVGVDPSMYSWGNMINAARMELGRDPIVWWSLAGAFIFMFVLVLAANIFADGVRDAFDPRTD
jgi:peptide/nickel transport system permease protein